MMRKALLCIAVGMLAAAACAHAQTPKSGGLLKFAVGAEPPNYDCHANSSFAFIHPVRPHYNTLLKFDTAKYPAIKGDLAESWTVAKDGLTYTFKVRKGVKFHDGTAFTSEDVKATYDRIRKPPPGVLSLRDATYADIASIETPDPNTVVFKLSKPNASMLSNFASPWDCIYSAARLKKDPKFPERNIMGTGPFTFDEHVAGSHWRGRKFKDYFEKGKPYLDGFSRDIHQRRADGECARRRRGARRVPRPFARRPRPHREGARRQGGGAGNAVGLLARGDFQHQEETVRRSARAARALALDRPLGRRYGPIKSRAGAARRRHTEARLRSGGVGKRAADLSGLSPRTSTPRARRRRSSCRKPACRT